MVAAVQLFLGVVPHNVRSGCSTCIDSTLLYVKSCMDDGCVPLLTKSVQYAPSMQREVEGFIFAVESPLQHCERRTDTL